MEPGEQGGKQQISFDQMRALIGAPEQATHDAVAELYKRTAGKVDSDLIHGFTAWVEENDIGTAVVYEVSSSGTNFMAKKTLIDGIARSSQVSGEYQLGKDKFGVSVDQETGSPFVTCRVYLNNSLVASRTSPFDWAGQQADAFVRNMVESNEGNASRLDKTVQYDRSPYPFALKMLQDFSTAVPDQSMINSMALKMKKSSTVVMNKDYLLSS